ncbi:unnamed protein product, partial [marine sediment metagenome]
EWMTKLLNLKNDPEYKKTIKKLAKDKKFNPGEGEEVAQFNFELIVSSNEPIADTETKSDENKDEYF